MAVKALIWLGGSLKDLRGFPALAKRLAGFQLRRVQLGLDPDDWKPMKAIGPGVREIRVHVEGAHRVFYVTTRPEGIYVLHAFEKKTRKTSAADLKLGRQRFRSLEKLRQSDGKKRDA
jgi:phage-related protein